MASSARSPAASPKRRYGSETPRIFTPPLRRLTKQTTLGYAAIEFAEVVCGIVLFPWQRWLLIHSLELAPGLTVSTMGKRDPLEPLFRFRKVVVLVARQNGKSTLSQVLSLFFLYVLGTDLVLGTAQDLDTAEEVWDGALDIIEETPDLAALADKPIRVNGKKTIRLLSGERYKVKAANRRAGRGLSGDLILLDELREHQSWDAWGAITKTTNARPAAMIWALSNAGDAASIVLRYLRKMAHAALDDPDGINAEDDPIALLPTDEDLDQLVELADDLDFALDVEDLEEDISTLGIFEWSAPPDCDLTDIDGILQANPSTGYCISLRTLLDDARSDPEWVFRTECLCQWSEGTLDGPFPAGAWDKCLDDTSTIDPASPITVALDVAWDRTYSHIAAAGWRAGDGQLLVEVIAQRAGTDWVVEWFLDEKYPERKTWPIGVQGKGAPVSSLIKALRDADLEVVEISGADLGAACGEFYDRVRSAVGEGSGNARLWHLSQPVLDVPAATAATRPLGDAWVWDRKKSPLDCSALVAATEAAWLLVNGVSAGVSAYESDDLMIV